MIYGINNNTGLPRENSGSYFQKIKKGINSAQPAIKDTIDILGEFKNAQTGAEKLKAIGKAVEKIMGASL